MYDDDAASPCGSWAARSHRKPLGSLVIGEVRYQRGSGAQRGRLWRRLDVQAPLTCTSKQNFLHRPSLQGQGTKCLIVVDQSTQGERELRQARRCQQHLPQLGFSAGRRGGRTISMSSSGTITPQPISEKAVEAGRQGSARGGGQAGVPSSQAEVGGEAAAGGVVKKKKICCACPETKTLRDECVVEKGEAACAKLIEAHKQCLRAEGFNV